MLEQDFALLEDAIEGGVWEVDGDELNLYVSDGSDVDGPAGAVLVTEGGSGSSAEIVHRLREGQGARVVQLRMRIIAEELDVESTGMFTVCLAFDEDLEESSLMTISVRRPTLPPGEQEEADTPPRPVELRLNGETCRADVGSLPVLVELNAELCWDSGARSIRLRHRTSPAKLGIALPSEDAGAGNFKETSSGFYTTSVQFDRAKTICLRAMGTSKVRILSLYCAELDPVSKD